MSTTGPAVLPTPRISVDSRRGVRPAISSLAWAATSGIALECSLGAFLAPGLAAAIGWLAPVPLLLAIRRARTPVAAYGIALATGLFFWALHIRWMLELAGMNPANYSLAVAVLAILFGGLGPLVWLAQLAPVGARWLVAAAAWAVAEFARLHIGFLSIPFGMLANAQVDSPVGQLASVGGAFAVSFVVVGFAAAIAEWIDRRSMLELAAPVAVAVLAIGWGAARVELAEPAVGEPSVRVALVQAGSYQRSVDPPERRRQILDGYLELTRTAAAEGADLVVWPASSAQGSIPADTGLVGLLARTAVSTGTPILVGSSGQDKSAPGQRERATANSTFLFDSNGEMRDQYDKIRLLPFNEYLPLRENLRWPEWVAGHGVDARAGNRRTIFDVDGMRFGVLICWENLFADGFRSTVSQGLDFAVSATNEAFTRAPTAHRQMLSMNRLRATENGIPVLRVATTGVSAAIDRFGRATDLIADRSGETRNAVGHRIVDVPLRSEPSVYSRHGDVFVATCAFGLASVCGVGVSRRRAGAS